MDEEPRVRGASAPAPRLGLPRSARVTRRADFERAWKLGGRARGALLLVVACANGSAVARLGLSVGKKAWKRAVDRNRVRRVLREAFRLSRPDLAPGFDFLLVPVLGAPKPELGPAREELARLAPKAVARARTPATEGGRSE